MTETDGDVSEGKVADSPDTVDRIFPAEIRKKFEIVSYRNAATILQSSFPDQFADILSALQQFQISTAMIREPGGSKGQIAKYVDDLFAEGWDEARIVADLHVRLIHAKQKSNILREYIREGFLDGHRIDFVNGKVALDLEWNSKDQTYDRDLYAFSAFYDAGAIDVGIILTRGNSLDNTFFRSLGKVLKKDGTEGTEDVYKKFGASTTWMGKLLYRLDAGRNGGCPVLAIGIKPSCVMDWSRSN
ncbi:BglII/BstYI family type II restriction endonuclease [Yoonia sp. 2307UL14-13]|uniref:BglII/BstYI family type II restriction endonuclease n=1 Tax=Yoonia sp. 2307UL14-13 TaxID=3126506 RepID=UPI0030A090B3